MWKQVGRAERMYLNSIRYALRCFMLRTVGYSVGAGGGKEKGVVFHRLCNVVFPFRGGFFLRFDRGLRIGG